MTKATRREFLRHSGGLLLGAVQVCAIGRSSLAEAHAKPRALPSAAKPPVKTCRFVVAGGGAAGQEIMNQLRKAGYDVTGTVELGEAGGRVWSVPYAD